MITAKVDIWADNQLITKKKKHNLSFLLISGVFVENDKC
jgi:hypothetical protein